MPRRHADMSESGEMSMGTERGDSMPAQTLSIEIPDSVALPETLSQKALVCLLVDLMRSRGWIDD